MNSETNHRKYHIKQYLNSHTINIYAQFFRFCQTECKEIKAYADQTDPAIKSTPNDENINSISRWMTRNILFTLNRKLCSLAVLSLLLIVQYLHKKYLIYYYRIITHFGQYNNILLFKSTRLFCYFFLIIYPIRIMTALVMTLP